MTEDVEHLRRIYDALSRWDVDDLVTRLAHDIEWSLPETLPWGGTFHGHEGARAMLAMFRDHVEGAWADPDDFLDSGDRLVVLGRLRGTGRETGSEYEVEFAHVWTLSDGVASGCRVYYDTVPILAALGRSSR